MARAHGRSGIVLVPEIALTPQTVAPLRARFPGAVAVLHGAPRRSRRRALWHGLRSGAIGVVGRRPLSALFAPLRTPGLIVLDEEHEPSYKQERPGAALPRPRRGGELARPDGRRARAGQRHARRGVVSPRDAAGRYESLSLPRRVGAATRRRSRRAAAAVDRGRGHGGELRAGNANVFSRTLDAAMTETLAAGEQVLLFLNRRGCASLVLCRDCGFAPRCPRCSVAYALHADAGRLICHHCYHSRGCPPPAPSAAAPASSGRHRHAAPRGAGARALSRGARRALGQRHGRRARRPRQIAAAIRAVRSTSSSARRWWPRGTTSAD